MGHGYSINFPGNCGCSNHGQGIYGTNMWNINGNIPTNPHSCGHPQACNGCLEIIKDICIAYTGANLTSTGILKNDSLKVILEKLDAIKEIQDMKFAKILVNLNDINDRLNVITSGSHPPYTLL